MRERAFAVLLFSAGFVACSGTPRMPEGPPPEYEPPPPPSWWSDAATPASPAEVEAPQGDELPGETGGPSGETPAEDPSLGDAGAPADAGGSPRDAS
jgi:hypothetical protein